MVNKQIMGKERTGVGLGQEEQTRAHPGSGSWRALYRRKEAREGHCLQGALWSRAAYEKYLHAFTTLGLGALSCQVGTWGTRGPSALRWRLWAQSQRL